MKETYNSSGKNTLLLRYGGILIIILMMSIPSLNTFAQVTQEWVKTYVRHTTYNMQGPYFAVDKDGNSFMLGNDVINDTAYIVLLKHNSSGVLQWQKLYNNPNEPYYEPKGIVLDSLNNAYIIVNYGQGAFTAKNILTVKFNSLNGNVLWEKRYIGLYGTSSSKDIKIDKQNNIYIAGWSDTTLLCIKYNSITGDSIWVRRYMSPGTITSGNSCTIDDSSNVIITGSKAYCIPYPPPGGCFDSILTVKYNKYGILRWAKIYYNPNRPDYSIGLKVTNDQYGNIYVLGRTLNSTGLNIAVTLKYNYAGIQNWVSIYDGPGSNDDFIEDMIIDKIKNRIYISGSISVGGITYREGAIINYNTITGDSIWIRRITIQNKRTSIGSSKIDSFGNIYATGLFGNPIGYQEGIVTNKFSDAGNNVWQTTYNGFGSGRFLDIDKNRNVYITGSFEGNYIIIKYSQVEGIKIVGNNSPLKFTLYQNYPNPFNPTTKIKLSVPKKSYIQLKVYDVLGRIKEVLVDKELIPAEYETTLNSTNYSSGIYFYQLISDGQIIDTKKLTVVK